MKQAMQFGNLASVYLAVLSAYHVWSGGISFFAPDFALQFYRGMYGCDPVEQRHLKLVLRPWGALAIFAGAVGFLPFVEPAVRGWVSALLAGLLILRIGYRVGLRRELRELSRIEPVRNMVSVAMLVGGALVLATDALLNFIQ
jgi:hypothetical protein